MSAPRAHVTLAKVNVNMGDHAETVTEAVEVGPEETVQEVADRLLRRPNWLSITQGAPREPEYEWYLIVRLARPVGDGDE